MPSAISKDKLAREYKNFPHNNYLLLLEKFLSISLKKD